MRNLTANKYIPIFIVFAIAAMILSFGNLVKKDEVFHGKIRSTFSPKASKTSVEGRLKYFHEMMKDPKTGEIPVDAREKELRVLEGINNQRLAKTNAVNYGWIEAGPKDVGGRTRALAVDVANSNTIIAGGVSGGIWKSTDGGATWNMKTTSDQRKSVSCIAQDPRPGHTNIWYFGTGEYSGNSAGASGAYFYGSGIYKSVDNGDTWFILKTTEVGFIKYASVWNFVWNIGVSPTTGSVFAALANYGIVKSEDGGKTFTGAKTNLNSHSYCDVEVESNGTIIAALSMKGFETPPYNPGIWKSDDDGATWFEITPSDFPTDYQRVVLGSSASNTDVVYALVQGTDANKTTSLFNINPRTSVSTNLTSNLPNLSGRGGMDSQGGYDMVIKVKPDDENVVVFGLTNLYRSLDGFTTPANDEKQNWIGGYGNSSVGFQHPNHHPDQHSIAFDVNNPNHLWSGHDGGLSYTDDITNTNISTGFAWDDMNKGYNVTQFYVAAMKQDAGDNVILGGAQDNGSPSFTTTTSTIGLSRDVSSGDGSYCYMGPNYAYVSTQYGSMFRLGYNTSTGEPRNPYASGGIEDGSWSVVTPDGIYGSDGTLFINPFTVDPNNENRMFFLDNDYIWRNNSMKVIPDYNQAATTSGWERLDNLQAPTGEYFTAISYSTTPSDIVYYATSEPKLYKIEKAYDSAANLTGVDITSPLFPAGSYIKHIAVNPADANEIIVVMSNYSIDGTYLTQNGGTTWKSIEGNLKGNNDEGPSIRCAQIVNTNAGKIYFLGTSIGLFSTEDVSTSSTTWKQESPDGIGNTIVSYLISRSSDNRVLAATHGRGMFYGEPGLVSVEDESVKPSSFTLKQNYPNPFNPSTVIGFSLTKTSDVTLKVYNILGKEVATLIDANKEAGNYNIEFNASKLASGVYIYRLRSDNLVESKKMVLLR